MDISSIILCPDFAAPGAANTNNHRLSQVKLPIPNKRNRANPPGVLDTLHLLRVQRDVALLLFTWDDAGEKSIQRYEHEEEIIWIKSKSSR